MFIELLAKGKHLTTTNKFSGEKYDSSCDKQYIYVYIWRGRAENR